MYYSQALPYTKDRRTIKPIIPAIVKCPAKKNREIIVKIGAEE